VSVQEILKFDSIAPALPPERESQINIRPLLQRPRKTERAYEHKLASQESLEYRMLITDQVATAPGLTPDREHVFVELNRSGEFFWLEQSPSLPISDAIADLLLGHSQRR
jgi:hypothetical protein